jgi:hypothetical protein
MRGAELGGRQEEPWHVMGGGHSHCLLFSSELNLTSKVSTSAMSKRKQTKNDDEGNESDVVRLPV